ncbi:hypothetical protein ERIC1_1c34100 [Paenibacillus larvae subsp. larvae DSM 25719]|nr:hypothetical protein ERIC1_1c34100 [Paenibacillus larvae subsp. larvae DSM 25719]
MATARYKIHKDRKRLGRAAKGCINQYSYGANVNIPNLKQDRKLVLFLFNVFSFILCFAFPKLQWLKRVGIP